MDVILTQPDPSGPNVTIYVTPGKGLNGTFVGAKTPTVRLDGPHGGNIFIPNDGNLDGNFFNLGNQWCTTNFSACQSGFTLSVWFRVYKHGDTFTDVINSKVFQCLAYTGRAPRYTVTCSVLDTRVNKMNNFGGMKKLAYDWHLLALTYSQENGIKLYMDGCEATLLAIKKNNIKPRKNLQIGCRGTKNCARAQYDDLLIWHEEKSNRFIWQYYHQK